ncbi:hypothetical protein MKY19_09135 [Paenibacillus sp. FSL R5-0744]|uniref:hypothetical protein n=1 Tax=Paenibacillus sp. FSL R5-0744 TaxID=2921656 RepID=UPI0030DACC04
MDFVGTTLSGYTPHDPRSEGPDLELVRWMSEALCVTVRRGRRIRTPEEARDDLPASSVHSGSLFCIVEKAHSGRVAALIGMCFNQLFPRLLLLLPLD